MSINAGTNDEASTTRVDGTFSSLMRWYWPYVRPFRAQLAWVLAGIAVVLVCQAFIPLTVESILHHGEWDPFALSLLLAMVVIQLVVGHFAHIGGHIVASASATLLRLRIFDRTLHSKVLRQEGLVRSSVVSRHTVDVDHVSEAFDKTVNYGIPGVLRVIISLSLLTYIEWQAGVVMTIASLLFVLLRMWTGKSLVIADRDRLGASSRVGESVDEALTAPDRSPDCISAAGSKDDSPGAHMRLKRPHIDKDARSQTSSPVRMQPDLPGSSQWSSSPWPWVEPDLPE